MSKKNKQQTNEADVIVEEVAVEETVGPAVEEKPKKQKAAFQSENIKVEEKKQKVVADKNTNKKKKGEKKPNIFVRMGSSSFNFLLNIITYRFCSWWIVKFATYR